MFKETSTIFGLAKVVAIADKGELMLTLKFGDSSPSYLLLKRPKGVWQGGNHQRFKV